MGWLDAWRAKETSKLLLPGPTDMDLSNAGLSLPDPTERLRNYAAVLTRQVRQHSQCRWSQDGSGPEVVLRVEPQNKNAPEGFTIKADRDTVAITGRTERAVLFGIGRLLREMTMDWEQSYATPLRTSAFCPADLHIESQPDYPIRWHQIAYRPKTNSYDAFSVEDMKREILEAALFGCNGVEMIPPGLDDAGQSPHFQVPWLEMLWEASSWCDQLDLQVSMWFPNFPGSDEAHWQTVFSSLKRLDSLFVPGGDPGGLTPSDLFDGVERKAAFLRANFFPDVSVWVSSQYGLGVSVDLGLEPWVPSERLDGWFEELKTPRVKAFLDGVVYGPWSALPLDQYVARVPEGYLIRNYPDICHSASCEFPVRGWHPIFATAHLREGINPRPRTQAAIIASQAPLTDGCGCYSEGINDDVNKTVWSALHWGDDLVGPLQDAGLEDQLDRCLLHYAKLFLDNPRRARETANFIYRLEDQWSEPLDIDKVLRTADDAHQLGLEIRHQRNWRVNLLLLRAEFDAFLAARFRHESSLAERALQSLESDGSLRTFRAVLAESYPSGQSRLGEVTTRALKVEQLAALLFSQAGYQTTLAYGGQHRQRGAFLETRWIPLHNLEYLAATADESENQDDPVQYLKDRARLHFSPLWRVSFGEDDCREFVPPYIPLRDEDDRIGFYSPFVEHLATDDDEVLKALAEGKVPLAHRSWLVCIWPQAAVLELRIPLTEKTRKAQTLGVTWVGRDLNRMGGDWAELGRKPVPTRMRIGERILQDWFNPDRTGSHTYALSPQDLSEEYLTLIIEPKEPRLVNVNRVPVPIAEVWLT